MVCGVLPDIAKEVSAPLSNIESITMYDDKTTQLMESNTQKIDQILKVAQDSLGLDIKSLIAGYATNEIIKTKKEKNKNE